MRCKMYIAFLFVLVGLVDSQIQRVVVCDNHSRTVRCGYGQRIKVHTATYGRTDTQTCPRPGHRAHTTATHCQKNVKQKVRSTCAQRKYGCLLKASRARFGDPCPRTFKYLTVEFSCTVPRRSRPNTIIVCQNRRARLRCKKGERINIAYTTYGRTSKLVCRRGRGITWGMKRGKTRRNSARRRFLRKLTGKKRASRRKTVKEVTPITSENLTTLFSSSCRGSRESIHKVKAVCQDKRMCKVTASNDVFGDPCVGVNKYLVITYWCF